MTKISKAFLSVVLCAAFSLPLSFAAMFNNDNHSKLVRYNYEGNTFVTHKLSYIPDGYMIASSAIDTVNYSVLRRYKSAQGYNIELRQQTQAVVLSDTDNIILLSDCSYNYLITTDDPTIDGSTLNKIAGSITPPLSK